MSLEYGALKSKVKERGNYILANLGYENITPSFLDDGGFKVTGEIPFDEHAKIMGAITFNEKGDIVSVESYGIESDGTVKYYINGAGVQETFPTQELLN